LGPVLAPTPLWSCWRKDDQKVVLANQLLPASRKRQIQPWTNTELTPSRG
jgi:hypothetical protein